MKCSCSCSSICFRGVTAKFIDTEISLQCASQRLGERYPVTEALYLNVNVFSKKVLAGYTIFTSPTGDKAAILRVHPSYAKVQSFAGQMQYLHFSVILLKTLSIGPAPGIEPRTSRSYTVKCQLCRPS